MLTPLTSLRRLTLPQGARSIGGLQEMLRRMPRLYNVVYHGDHGGERFHRPGVCTMRGSAWLRSIVLPDEDDDADGEVEN